MVEKTDQEFDQLASQKAHWAAVVFAMLAGLLLLLFNLPYAYEDVASEWIGYSPGDLGWFGQFGDKKPIQAGFPGRYYFDFDGETSTNDGNWSSQQLTLNIFFAGLVTAVVYFMSRWRYQLKLGPQPAHRKRIVLDASIVVVCAVSVSFMAWSFYSETERHRRLAEQSVRYGSCFFGCQVPTIVKGKMPGIVSRFFSRIRVVNLSRPTDVILDEVVQLKSLACLRVQGGSVQTRHLISLRSKPLFYLLNLEGVTLTTEQVTHIGQLANLEELSLVGTNLDGKLLRHLDTLQRLKFVSFVRTPLRLSDLGTPAWKDSVRQVYLPRRTGGPEDHLRIDHWPSLQSIAITDPSLKISPNAIRLELTDCEKLRRLMIDRVQKYQLVAKDLPRFQEVSEDLDRLPLFDVGITGFPQQTWLSEVDIDGLASLEHLGVCATNLDSIRITNTPSLNHLTITEGEIVGQSPGSLITKPSDRLQKIIDHLALCDGPAIIQLERFNFKGIRLLPLCKNQRIRQLEFQDSEIEFSQLQQLAELTRLQSLRADLCQASADDLDWLLHHFPELETLDLDIGNVDELDLIERPILTRLYARTLRNVKRICVQSVPRLDTQIHVASSIMDLQVSDAPLLTGLGVEGPWPPAAKISGLRDLRWFAAGGPCVDDSVLSAILYCQSLDRLMLAYPSISKDSLHSIGGFNELTSLVVPGADVDDSVTSSFRKLRLLREVNFDDTKISANTTAWLLGIESMRRLSINYTQLPADAWRDLTRMIQLNELEIAGVPVSDDVFRLLILDLSLEHLNFSDHQITNTQFECLKKNHSLRLLNLSRCHLSQDQVRELLLANDKVLIYLGDEELLNSIDLDLSTPSLESRLLDKHSYQQSRLAMANYSVPHHISLSTARFLASNHPRVAEILFGWFESSSFRK